jgi:hypothetical protein
MTSSVRKDFTSTQVSKRASFGGILVGVPVLLGACSGGGAFSASPEASSDGEGDAANVILQAPDAPMIGLQDGSLDAGDGSATGHPGDGGQTGEAGDAADAADAADAGDASEAGDVVEEAAPTIPIVFVSWSLGADTNDGLSMARPKKTIASAIAAAGALSGPEVHVCTGTYVESALALTSAVTLKGAYDCATWTRTAAYGYPTFDKVNETIIQNASYGAQAMTLNVAGTVPSSVVIDGFTIQGAAPSAQVTGATSGVTVQGAASPVLSNDIITGGGGMAQSDASAAPFAASVGLSILGGASPEVAFDQISGGAGVGGASYGSVGAYLASTGTPYLHDDKITGGTSGVSAGLYTATTATAAGRNPLSGLVVKGADDGFAVSTSSAGIVMSGSASVDVVASDVYGNDKPSGTCSSWGVLATTSGAVRLSGCRVYGGSCEPSTYTDDTVLTYGIYASGTGSLEADNCMIHAGEGSPEIVDKEEYVLSLTSSAAVYNAEKLTLNFDTLYVRGPKNDTNPATGPLIDERLNGIWFAGGSATVENTLLVGGNSVSNLATATTSALWTVSCMGVTRIEHSVLANFDQAIWCDNSMPLTGGFDALTGTYSADLSPLGSAATADFVADSPNQTCDLCPTSVFANWSASDDGLSALFSSTQTGGGTARKGWALAPSTPCTIAQGGVSTSTLPLTDINGVTRSASTPTVGASEFSGTCVQ